MATRRSWTRSSVVAGVVGVFAGGLTIFLVEAAGHALFGTADPTDLSGITGPMFASVLVAWVVGSAVAGAVAAAWARRGSAGVGAVVGLVLLAAAVSNMVAFPHPAWMMVGAVVLMPTAAWLAARSVTARTAG